MKRTKDGYAVAGNMDHVGEFEVMENWRAGKQGGEREVKEGQAVYVTTGTAVPEGTTEVVKVEVTKRVENSNKVQIWERVGHGNFIRSIGCDVKQGELILKKGDVIMPAEIGMLATFGISKIDVIRRPNVIIISTGNELVQVSDAVVELPKGIIYDSNTLMLHVLSFEYEYSNYRLLL